MSKVQVLKIDGKPAFYVVPADLWTKVKDALEDVEDAAACAEAVANDDGVRFPASVAMAMADGMHPVQAWRKHKGLTTQALADAAGVSKPYVSQIESGKRKGTTKTLKALADALGVPVGALVL